MEKILNQEQLKRVEKYIDSFSLNSKITVSKFSNDTNLETALSINVLKLLVDMEVLIARFAVCCPDCGFLISIVDDFSEIDKITECYQCENECEIALENVEVIYTVNNIPFAIGRRSDVLFQPMSVVLTEDTLANFLEINHYNLNEIYYKPTEEEFAKLKEQYDGIFMNGTTISKGKGLESLVLSLFNMCKHFEATDGLRPKPNQVDCYVRNKLCSPGVPGLGKIKRFCIECKNENQTPKIGYMNKLHSILSFTNIKFGIIVSKCKAPSTFNTLANKLYLSEDIVIIAIDSKDLENIIIHKNNLLDLIEMKISDVMLDATKSLRELGLYSNIK